MRALTLTLAALLAAAAGTASAAPVTENFTITASGFSDLFGASTPPADPVTLTVALSFDPAMGDQFANSSGVRLLGSTVPVDGGLTFNYDSANDILTFGGSGLAGIGITAGTNDLLATINTPYRGVASFGQLDYASSGASGIYESVTGSVQVPEPAPVALLATAMAGLLVTRRRI